MSLSLPSPPGCRRSVGLKKAARDQYSYNDMIRLVREARRKAGQEADSPIGALPVAMIDEFQDTDGAQWAIFKTVFAESSGHTLCLIRDPKQAIYGFQGGERGDLFYSHAISKAQRGSRLHLAKNYRSNGHIQATNALFSGDIAWFYAHPRQDGRLSTQCRSRYGPQRLGRKEDDRAPLVA